MSVIVLAEGKDNSEVKSSRVAAFTIKYHIQNTKEIYICVQYFKNSPVLQKYVFYIFWDYL